MADRAGAGGTVIPVSDRIPTPRGIVFAVTLENGAGLGLEEVEQFDTLAGWHVRRLDGPPGWFDAAPPVGTLTLSEVWAVVRKLQALPAVVKAEPLLVVQTPGNGERTIGLRDDEFGLWGWPYDSKTRDEIARNGRKSDWHLEQMHVPEAWRQWVQARPGKIPGEGIVIGHPDTGYTRHTEIAGKLVEGHSFIDDGDGEELIGLFEPVGTQVGPTSGEDPLDAGFLRSPGHGTATASVIVSGGEEARDGNKEVFGVSPGARLIPLRVSGSVIHFDFENVARAIVYAVDHGADVISLSLGGPFRSLYLHDCIRYAVSRGVIVVSAAGNYLPTVVFPAAFPEVVAVAATHAAGEPWRHSGLGKAVDIAAPGEGVWCARTRPGKDGQEFASSQGTGTSFATANIAGLAALWLSRWGGRKEIAREYGNRLDLVALAFKYQLARTADTSADFVTRSRHGAGIADARRLLAELPPREEIERFATVVREQSASVVSTLTGLFTGWLGASNQEGFGVDLPAVTLALSSTIAPDGGVLDGPVAKSLAARDAKRQADNERAMLKRLLGDDVDRLADELLVRVATDASLLVAFQRWRPGESLLPLFDHLLRGSPGRDLSQDLWTALTDQRNAEARRVEPLYRGRLALPLVRARLPPGGPEAPSFRRIRAYAFDPSQETTLETQPISQVTIPVRWEILEPGPVGEYLEVVDIDPASGCVYSPVDLDHPHVLAQEGLAPSEGNPQFHQQMVYAVAMNTIQRFELALGRPMFWRPIRPWTREREEKRRFTRESFENRGESWIRDRYVKRLRIYPHALREANAYYSPAKRALMFGYFPGSTDPTGKHFPGGMVFSCLSHDIIVHETTHALIDGMHPYYTEQVYGDTWAFHEAFADVIALFQHFTYPEVLRHQIARTRGDLETNNLLGQLAQQFGQATRNREALRSALGEKDEHDTWQRAVPNPRALETRQEHHERGSILVAAIFDAFLKVYNGRTADLYRIATGGTGVIPAGRIHPDLVARLADTAAETAEDILTVCIRALDFLPPVDIDFGEFLRALITADMEITPTDRREVRVAFIESFRAWGIYPENVMTLSEESLKWRPPGSTDVFTNLLGPERSEERIQLEKHLPVLHELRRKLEAWEPGKKRDDLFRMRLEAQSTLHSMLEIIQKHHPERSIIPGLDLRGKMPFEVSNARLARRIGPRGHFRNELIAEVVQVTTVSKDPGSVPQRGGATLIVDMSTWHVNYVIYKRLYQRLPEGKDGGELAMRIQRRASLADVEEREKEWKGEGSGSLVKRLAETYGMDDAVRGPSADPEEPFALLHRSHDGFPFR